MSSIPESLPPEVEAACQHCGAEAAMVIDGKGWCASCIHARGSCCAESEMEDSPADSCRTTRDGR